MMGRVTPHTSSPQLGWSVVYVSDVAATVDLYQRAFGLEVAFAHPSGDYTEFATGDTALAACSITLASDATSMPLAERTSPTGNITLVVDNVADAYQRATEAGCVGRVEPVTKPWGQESSYVTDLDNNLIELATTVPR